MSDPIRELLERLRAGEVSVDDALKQLPLSPVAALDFATVDLDRQRRCGFPEVVYAPGKHTDWLGEIVGRIASAGQDCLVTRLDDAQSAYLHSIFPMAEQDRLARTFWLPHGPRPTPVGRVAIVTAGTSDLPVAQEALVTAQALGCEVERIVDVGVAGLHRVLRQRERLAAVDAVVVVAGMDGALPSVVGGLVDRPVIAVPTSVGYGAAFGGIAPLLTMLNSCAANVVVVNIDAGFKAGFVAALIARGSMSSIDLTDSTD